MRILYHHRTFSGDGQEVHIRAIIRALREEGHEVREVALVRKDPQLASHRGAGRVAGPARRLLGSVRGLPQPVLEVVEHSYSVVGAAWLVLAGLHFRPDFLYERYAFGNAAGVLAARLLRRPVVLEVNAPLVQELSLTRKLVFEGIARRLQRRILSSADLVCAVSRELAAILATEGVPKDRLVVVPNGVDLNAYRYPPTAAARESARRALGLAPESVAEPPETVVGFVGYFRRWHGLDVLLRAVAECPDRSIRLVLIGDGPQKKHLWRLAGSLGIAERVRFAGVRPAAEIPQLLPAFEVAVVASAVSYSAPLKLTEYMAAGVAIAAPDQPNITSLVSDRGEALLFEPGSVGGLARALAELAADPELRRRLGAAARAAIERRQLTWKAAARRVVEALRSSSPRVAPE